MKKLILISSVIFALFLAACGEVTESEPKPDDQKKEVKNEEKPKETKPKEANKDPIDQIKSKKYVASVEFEDDNTLDVEIDATNAVSVNAIYEKVTDILEDMKIAFEDKKVTGYYAIVNITVVDGKGNEKIDEGFNMYYSRSDFEALSYDNFNSQSYSQPWMIFNESTSYLINPVVFDEVKNEYRSKLTKGNNKPLLVE